MNELIVSIGAGLLMAIGGALMSWPEWIANRLTHDEDGNPLPVTPAHMRHARYAGLALIAFGVGLLWCGADAFKGTVDGVGP